MPEQIKIDDVVTSIMCGLTRLIDEQARLNDAQAVIYMALHNVMIYKEESGLSTQMDDTGEWARLCLSSMLARGCTRKTVEAYAQEYKTFLGAVNKPAREITTGDVRGYLAYCRLSRHNGDQTINNKTRMLRGLFRWLEEEEYISRNPMIRIKDSRVEHKVKEVFADEQVTIIKDAAMRRGARDVAIVDFLHRTGARISEMVALDRDDVDLSGRQCVVYGKGRKERTAYFNAETAVHLKEYLASRSDDNPALFVSLRKPYGRLTDDGVRAMLKALAGTEPRLRGVAVNPHKWRRQFATELLERDVPLTLVADLMGHKDLNTTKDNYGNYNRNKARDAHRKYL